MYINRYLSDHSIKTGFLSLYFVNFREIKCPKFIIVRKIAKINARDIFVVQIREIKCPRKLVRIRYLKWILFCNVLHQPSKTAIRVRFTIPSSPHEFLKVFLQEVRICVPFHPLKFVLCCGPIALCVLCMDTGDWVYKVNRVINRLMIETQDPLHSSVCRPFISINPRAWLYVSLDSGQKSTCISPSHKL